MPPTRNNTGYKRPVNQRNSSNVTYIHGTAARKVATKPVPQKQANRQQNKKLSVNYQEMRKAQLRMQIQFIICTVAMCAVMFPLLLHYIKLNSEINQLTYSIAEIEDELYTLQRSNDEYRDRIESSIDLEEVRMVAIAELGMVYPGEDQVVYYESQIDDYVESSKIIE